MKISPPWGRPACAHAWAMGTKSAGQRRLAASIGVADAAEPLKRTAGDVQRGAIGEPGPRLDVTPPYPRPRCRLTQRAKLVAKASSFQLVGRGMSIGQYIEVRLKGVGAILHSKVWSLQRTQGSSGQGRCPSGGSTSEEGFGCEQQRKAQLNRVAFSRPGWEWCTPRYQRSGRRSPLR